jgi:DNA primase
VTYGSYKDYISAVRNANELRQVMAERKIRVNNSNTAICPFHPDNDPSLSVHVPRQFYRCFGCGETGDVFALVMKLDGVGFRQAVTTLATRAGLPTFRPVAQELEEAEQERRVGDVVEAVTQYYQACMMPDAVRYLTDERGLPASVVADYRLGWANGTAWAAVSDKLGPEWLSVLKRAGLAHEARNSTAGQWRDTFFDRLMFPVLRHGLSVFLTGRSIDGRDPKYLHQSGREAPFYNEDALGPGDVVVTEGPLDALSLACWGYPAVALLGGMRESAIGKLRRPQRVLVCLDADRAGRSSVMKLATALGSSVRVVRLPDGQDPNDFYRTGTREDFARRVASAVDPVTFWLELVPATTTPTELSGKLEPLFRMLATLAPLSTEAYLQDLIAPHYGLSRTMTQAFRKELDEYRNTARLSCPACGAALVGKRR